MLSNPKLKTAIESAFVPVAIFNNAGGDDRKILKKFGEPSWNYQVVRFLDIKEKDLIPRKDKVWTIKRIAGRMIAALNAAKKPIPPELKALAS